MKIILSGLYPRSEQLIAASRDFDRQRISRATLLERQHQDAYAFKRLQKGFSYMSTGLFNWQDLMRPFIEILSQSQAGSLVRYFETNVFWKVLELTEESDVIEDHLDKWVDDYFFAGGVFEKDDPIVFTLPFLFLFKEFSRGMSLMKISQILEIVIHKLSAFPNKLLCFCEPMLSWRDLDEGYKDFGMKWIEHLKKKFDIPIVLQVPFFSVHKVLSFLVSMPVDGLGIDFYANSFKEVIKNFPRSKFLMAGVITIDTPLIESEKNIKPFLDLTHEYVDVYLTTNAFPELLSRKIMDDKLINLIQLYSSKDRT